MTAISMHVIGITAIVEIVIALLVFVGGYHVATHVAIDAMIGVMTNVKQSIIIN